MSFSWQIKRLVRSRNDSGNLFFTMIALSRDRNPISVQYGLASLLCLNGYDFCCKHDIRVRSCIVKESQIAQTSVSVRMGLSSAIRSASSATRARLTSLFTTMRLLRTKPTGGVASVTPADSSVCDLHQVRHVPRRSK